jgi:hypothetical protein
MFSRPRLLSLVVSLVLPALVGCSGLQTFSIPLRGAAGQDIPRTNFGINQAGAPVPYAVKIASSLGVPATADDYVTIDLYRTAGGVPTQIGHFEGPLPANGQQTIPLASPVFADSDIAGVEVHHHGQGVPYNILVQLTPNK